MSRTFSTKNSQRGPSHQSRLTKSFSKPLEVKSGCRQLPKQRTSLNLAIKAWLHIVQFKESSSRLRRSKVLMFGNLSWSVSQSSPLLTCLLSTNTAPGASRWTIRGLIKEKTQVTQIVLFLSSTWEPVDPASSLSTVVRTVSARTGPTTNLNAPGRFSKWCQHLCAYCFR